MESSSDPPSGEKQPSNRQLQIQGPRPTPLSVQKDSRKIKKLARPRTNFPPQGRRAEGEAGQQEEERRPLVIYDVSPKVIHLDASEFRTVVQRLTGNSSSVYSGDEDLSPAARLAATERASPREKPGRSVCSDLVDIDELMSGLVEEKARGWGEEWRHMQQGILSPAPAMLPNVPAGLFSPANDPAKLLSPFFLGSSLMASPGVLSPSISLDVFGNFWDF